MSTNADIVVVGCINSDIVAFVSRLPSAGETVFSSAVETHFGGKGANQATQAALLLHTSSSTLSRVGHECSFGFLESSDVQNAQKTSVPALQVDANNGAAEPQRRSPPCGVAVIGRVGKDTAGSSFLRHFSSLGIDSRGVEIDPENGTGTALVTVAEGGENTIAYIPAANAFICKEHISREPTLSLLRNAKVVVSENGIPGPVSAQCFRIAKDANATTIFTPAPADFVDPEICCFIDYLLCNAVEAHALLRSWGIKAEPDEVDDAEVTIASRLHDGILHTARGIGQGPRGLANVIITRGSQPCIVFANGNVSLVPVAHKIPNELVVDTTGAGDSFAGAFAYFLLLTPNSPTVAVSRATYVAARSVTKKGAAESYAKRSDLPEHLFVPQ